MAINTGIGGSTLNAGYTSAPVYHPPGSAPYDPKVAQDTLSQGMLANGYHTTTIRPGASVEEQMAAQRAAGFSPSQGYQMGGQPNPPQPNPNAVASANQNAAFNRQSMGNAMMAANAPRPQTYGYQMGGASMPRPQAPQAPPNPYANRAAAPVFNAGVINSTPNISATPGEAARQWRFRAPQPGIGGSAQQGLAVDNTAYDQTSNFGAGR